LSRSLFLAVPIDLVAVSSFRKQDFVTVVVHMHRDVRNYSSSFRNAIMTFLTKYGPTPHGQKCCLEHQSLFRFSGRVWKQD